MPRASARASRSSLSSADKRTSIGLPAPLFPEPALVGPGILSGCKRSLSASDASLRARISRITRRLSQAASDRNSRSATAFALSFISGEAPLGLLARAERHFAAGADGARWVEILRDGVALCTPGPGETLLRGRTHRAAAIKIRRRSASGRKRRKKCYVRATVSALMVGKFLINWCARRDYSRCALTPSGSPCGRSTWPQAKLSNSACCLPGVRTRTSNVRSPQGVLKPGKLWCARRDSNSRPPGS